MKKVLVAPDPRLRKACAEVFKVDGRIKKLANDLLEILMSDHFGPDGEPITPVAIAASQVGELVQLFVINTPAYSLIAVNPRITTTSGLHKVEESCLSLPGRTFIVERPKKVKFTCLTLDGVERTIRLHDFLAQIAVHEMDHLGGVLLEDIAIEELPQ